MSNPPETFALGEHQKMCQLLGLSDEQLEAHVPHHKCQARPSASLGALTLLDTYQKNWTWVEQLGTIQLRSCLMDDLVLTHFSPLGCLQVGVLGLSDVS